MTYSIEHLYVDTTAFTSLGEHNGVNTLRFAVGAWARLSRDLERNRFAVEGETNRLKMKDSDRKPTRTLRLQRSAPAGPVGRCGREGRPARMERGGTGWHAVTGEAVGGAGRLRRTSTTYWVSEAFPRAADAVTRHRGGQETVLKRLRSARASGRSLLVPDPRVPPEKSVGIDRACGAQKSWAQGMDHDAVVPWCVAAGLASG
jgi:hypothetical protein